MSYSLYRIDWHNGKFYIGLTSGSVAERIEEHKRDEDKAMLFQTFSFSYMILDSNLTREQAFEKETSEIQLAKAHYGSDCINKT